MFDSALGSEYVLSIMPSGSPTSHISREPLDIPEPETARQIEQPSLFASLTPPQRPEMGVVVSHYLVNSEEYPLLTIAQEQDLAAKVQAGDEQARETMILSNRRFVVKIAREFEGFGLDLEDLLMAGSKGLVKAVGKFRPGSAKFSTYGSWWIKQAIKDALLKEVPTVSLPAQKVYAIRRLDRACEFFKAETGRQPTAKELAKEVNLKVDQVEKLLRISNATVSLDGVYDQDGSGRASGESDVARVADPNAEVPGSALAEAEYHAVVRGKLQDLRPRERDVLIARFGLNGGAPQTLETIGQRYHLTRERIRQIEAKALRKLRGLVEKAESY